MTDELTMLAYSPDEYRIEFWTKQASLNQHPVYEVYLPDADVILGDVIWTDVYQTDEDEDPEHEFVFIPHKNVLLQTGDMVYIAEFVEQLNE